MRNFYLLQTLPTYFCLLSGFILSAQQIVVEQSRTVPESQVKYKHNFEEQNYTKILDENGKRVYIPNNLSGQNNAPNGEEDVENVTLNINLVFDPNQHSAPWIIQVFDETGYSDFAFWEGTNPVSLDVPPGSYDIVADFSSGFTSYTVIKELVEVQEETTIEVNVAEADNYVSINTFDETGDVLNPGEYNEETGAYSELLFDRLLYFVPTNSGLASNSYIWGTPFDDGTPVWNFYINDVSDRYAVIQSIIGTGFETGNYFAKYETLNNITESVTLENNPEGWVFHGEKFQPGILGEAAGAVYPGFSTLGTWEGNGLGGWTVYSTASEYNPEEGFKAYLNNPFDEDSGNLLVFPAIVDHIGIVDPGWGEEGFLINGNAIVAGSNDEVIYGSGNLSFSWYFLGNDFYYTENGLKVLPFHPQFSFTSTDNPNIIQGNNTPIAVTMGLNTQYKGRYGEIRESDFFNTSVEIKQNSNVIFSGSYLDFMQFSLPATGLLEATLTNINVEVDGLAGKNVTRVTFDRNGEDSIPPTLQILQFRDTSGKVTDRFASAAEGTIRLAAGDFEYDTSSFSYVYNEGNTVELFYSIYDQNEWTGLPLTEYPEHFLMPAFGDYYEASLAGIENSESDVWYDVKIVSTDTAGNSQEQTVSPAFKLNSTLTTDDTTHFSELALYPNPFSGLITIKLPETLTGNYTFKVTDLSGKTVYAEQRNSDAAKTFAWNGSHLPKGVYVFSIESGNQVVAKNVIKK